MHTDMPRRGLDDRSVFEQLAYAARRMILENYAGILLPQKPISHITPAKCERNEEIRLRHQQGETLISSTMPVGNVIGPSLP